MKNKYSSRKIIIPCFIFIIIFAIGSSAYFFNRLQKIFQTRQNQEAFAHIEDFATTAAENTRLNFFRNWQTVEGIAIFCESYIGTDFGKLKTFIHSKKYDWNILRITLCTENGMMYNEMGEVVFREKLKNYIGALKDLKKVYSQDGMILDYLQYVDSNILINGSKLIGVSTSIDINSVLLFNNTKQFDAQEYLCLIDNNGTKIAEGQNQELNFPGNLFTYLKDCDVINVNKEYFSISTSLQESKVFKGIMKNNNTNVNHYFACYPIEPRDKYEPTRCHLLFMVPEEVVGRNHYDFSKYLTRVSGILITIICILMLLVFLLAYKSKSKMIQNSMEQKEVSQNEKLKIALAMAEQSNSAKTSFLSNMSHDIRTPLNAIISMSDFALQEKDIPPKVLNYLGIIKNSSNHLMQLINNVLDMTRIESGKMLIKNDPFDISVLINDVTNIIRPDCKKKKITLYTESDIEHNLLVGDKLNVQRILINLLSNAVKFTPELGSIWFTIEENKSIRAGTCSLKISVEDTGFGIKKENLETIFKPFTRENNTKTSNIEGTGLGLAITKNLIEAMGGCIFVESEENKGTKFVVEIFFPICMDEKIQVDTAPKDDNKFGYNFGGINALVVEDNSINRQIINVLLQHININCDFAENGKIALEKFNKAPKKTFDLIYMDIQMPELNGYETTEALRNGENEEGHTIPIIAMTANVFDEDVEKCRKAGMNAHIGKPIDPSQLAYVTNQVLSKNKTDEFTKIVGGGYFISDK